MSEENWRDQLPDELKGNESLASFEDVGALAQSFVETKKMVGNAVHFPTEEASEEARAEFYGKVLEKAPDLMRKPNFDDEEQSVEFFKTLGMPDTSEAYDPPKFEERTFEEHREKTLRDLAHKARLTKKQFAQLTEGMLAADHEAIIGMEAKNAEQMKELKQEWGMTFDERKVLADKVRDTFFDFIPEGQMDARTIKSLYNIGKQLNGEGGGMGDHRNEGGGEGKMTPADALAKISDIMNNREHAYWNSHHPEHQQALQQMVELRKMADPSAGTSLPRAGFTG